MKITKKKLGAKAFIGAIVLMGLMASVAGLAQFDYGTDLEGAQNDYNYSMELLKVKAQEYQTAKTEVCLKTKLLAGEKLKHHEDLNLTKEQRDELSNKLEWDCSGK